MHHYVVEMDTICLETLAFLGAWLTCAFRNIENNELSTAYIHEKKETEPSKKLNENSHINTGKARPLLEYLFYFS
ncbi:MAG: hypothetical protein COB20_15285 [SAR86 cluster bacterium]|uniref:Uncharacterized protein n=1 Tax=SAR86 cluster bacterium TaxID=2030880 RepID=A0A2A4WWA8_9GAMM|nr:MAG: hypothetical protein COB20_15285 [SAR86 cluster bacterium]